MLLALRRSNSDDSPRWEVPVGPPSHLYVCADVFSEVASVQDLGYCAKSDNNHSARLVKLTITTSIQYCD